MAQIIAPFTDEQLENLRAWQAANDRVHPFTCNIGHRTQDHPDGEGKLIPTREGWICPVHPEYKQDWAHDFMCERVCFRCYGTGLISLQGQCHLPCSCQENLKGEK